MWLEVATMGFLANRDRTVTLRQVESEEPMAQLGVRYVTFTDPEVQAKYVIKAGENKARVPIILLRNASMKDSEFTLDIKIVANDYFGLGYEDRLVSCLRVSDMVVQPEEWDTNAVMNVLGDYGLAKYRLMIDATTSMKIRRHTSPTRTAC